MTKNSGQLDFKIMNALICLPILNTPHSRDNADSAVCQK